MFVSATFSFPFTTFILVINKDITTLRFIYTFEFAKKQGSNNLGKNILLVN